VLTPEDYLKTRIPGSLSNFSPEDFIAL